TERFSRNCQDYFERRGRLNIGGKSLAEDLVLRVFQTGRRGVCRKCRYDKYSLTARLSYWTGSRRAHPPLRKERVRVYYLSTEKCCGFTGMPGGDLQRFYKRAKLAAGARSQEQR